MVCSASKSINLQLVQSIPGKFCQEPVDYKAGNNATLTVCNDNDLRIPRIDQVRLYVGVCFSYILCRVSEISLNETLYEIEYDADPGIVNFRLSSLEQWAYV